MTSFIAEQHGIKVSVNDIIIKAVAIALRNVPEANGNFKQNNHQIPMFFFLRHGTRIIYLSDV